ncbi:OmcA/MtrC family decaheme c-type cytochrome [Shewanella abyssi]|uniref:OmcA/MtrC family decaheme c-type cytochrome n=1 Tax=Shewanella abyssi TaxID=311789 RepID=UPI00200CF827|nr:OmcA/MtrC family decaheme c-type cytochrome [Shewanella abyssi]MCL1050287.1 OmcA/MtrC family decaheme c-type cytochrome [Shewanella abyssi]
MSNIREMMMSNFKNTSLALLIGLALVGCGSDGADGSNGSNGSNGENGENGAPAPIVFTTADQLNIAITDAVLNDDNKLAISFNAANNAGYGIVGVDNIRLNVAKLVPGTNGESSEWVSFTYGIRVSSINENEYAKPDSEKSSKTDGLTDNSDGSYSYTFAADVANAINPVTDEAIAWDATSTHRVTLQVYSAEDRYDGVNTHFDWVPNGDEISFTRDIVSTASCNECHTDVTKHGGRTDIEYCVVCHTPDVSDPAKSVKDSADMKVMTHKIHMGAQLTGAKTNDYGKVLYPQDIRNCTSCHVGEEDKAADDSIIAVATKDGDNWKTVPTIETCGSCHDGIVWDASLVDVDKGIRLHTANEQTNDTCVNCHDAGSFAGADIVHVKAYDKYQSTADELNIRYEVTSLTRGSGNELVAHVEVTMDGEPADMVTDIQPVTMNASGGPRIMFNWDNGMGYETHSAKNTPNSQLLIAATGVVNDGCFSESVTGSYTCTWVTDTGLDDTMNPKLNGGAPLTTGHVFTSFVGVGIDVGKVDSDLEGFGPPVPPTIVNTFFNMEDLSIDSDFKVEFGADYEGCNSCHKQLIQHGSRRSDHASQCKACHNSTRVRKGGASSGDSGDLKYEAHKTHASFQWIDNDNTFKLNGRQAGMPSPISDCAQCHTEDQIALPLSKNTRPSIVATPDFSGTGDNLDFTGSAYVSPITSVCSSCHVSVGIGLIDAQGKVLDGANVDGEQVTLSADDQAVVSHMISNGAAFNAMTTEAATGTESCSVCHDTEELREVHGQ